MRRKEAFISVTAFLLTVLLLVAATLLMWLLVGGAESEENGIAVISEPRRTVVIDAGHGGMDGGAVAADGTLEKQINLQIAKTVEALFRISGYDTVMTRSEDEMLDTADGNGSAKMRDLKRRLEIASAYPDAITVSIHCNKFPLESCKGMQVYHSESDTAKNAAQAVQSTFLELDPSNHRAIKKADSSIYLLYRAKSPTVLVECGFLSNNEELARLKTDEYKKKLALVIMSGIDSVYTKAAG